MRKYFESHVLGWIGAALVGSGYYLNANGSIECWPVWLVGNLFIAKYCLDKKAYAAAVMSVGLIILNIYGYVRWLDL